VPHGARGARRQSLSHVRPGIADAAAALRREFDESFSRARVAPERAGEAFLGVRVGGASFALRVADLLGVHADRTIVPIPSATPGYLGVAGVRGVLTSVFDLGAFLGFAAAPSPRWIAVAGRGGRIGLAFESLESHIRATPGRAGAGGVDAPAYRHIQGAVQVGTDVYPVIDLPPLLEEIEKLVVQRETLKES